MWAIALKLFTNKTSLTIILISIITMSIIGVYKYQEYTISKYEKIIEEQKNTNEQLKESLNRAVELTEHLIDTNNQLIVKLDKAIANLNNLNSQNKIVRDKIDSIKKEVSDSRLKSLTAKKPGLIESKVNKATKEVFESLEEETNAN